VRIFILPGLDVTYILSLLLCPGFTQIFFTRFGAEKDFSDVVFAVGKNKSRTKTFQTPGNTKLALSETDTVSRKFLWHREYWIK